MAKRTQKADIKIRLTEALRAKIEKAAKTRGVSMNSEMIDRLSVSFERAEAAQNVQEWLADARKVVQQGRDQALRSWGFVPVTGRPGHWIESDKLTQQEMVALNPALETLIERVVLRTLEKAKSS